MKELVKFHDRGDEKMKDFDHFVVGEHPDYAKTRCFFAVSTGEAKTDFSISKCIANLEKQT